MWGSQELCANQPPTHLLYCRMNNLDSDPLSGSF